MAKKGKTDNVQTAEHRRKQLAKEFSKQEKMPVSISPLYKPHFGNSMTVSINGIAVVIPCDGRTYRVPRAFAVEALGRISKIDKILEKKNRMKNVSSNFERNPGELTFF